MNIIMVEDDNKCRENLKILLSGESDIGLLESFSSSEDAMSSGSWTKADILLTDIELPAMNGVELITWVKVNFPDISCMAYTIFDNRSLVFSAIRAGACGYLLKGASPRKLLDSLRDIYQGGSPMSSSIARQVIQALQNQPVEDNQLTLREQEVLRCIERGLSYKDVAEELGISPHTVHAHIKNTYEKVQAGDRNEVLRKARRLGWI